METQEMKHTIKVIAFDADDTLWSNEPFFQEVERKYTELLSEYGNPKEISVELFKTEMENLLIFRSHFSQKFLITGQLSYICELKEKKSINSISY